MYGEVTTNQCSDNLIGAKSSVTEILCEACERKIERNTMANNKICPDCGGSLVGIRIIRNALTGKILIAERVDF